MSNPKVGDTWYRYHDYRESRGYIDVCGEYVSTGSSAKVRLDEYTVTKVTPKGVILDGHRFVCHHWTKRFACATVEEAKESFMKRKERERGIYSARMRHIDEVVWIVAGKGVNNPLSLCDDG